MNKHEIVNLIKRHLSEYENVHNATIEARVGGDLADAFLVEFVYGNFSPNLHFGTELSYQLVCEMAEQEMLQEKPLLKYLIEYLASESLQDFCEKEGVEYTGL